MEPEQVICEDNPVPLNGQVLVEFEEPEFVHDGIYLINDVSMIAKIIAIGDLREEDKKLDKVNIGDRIVVDRSPTNLESTIVKIGSKQLYIYNIEDILGLVYDED